MKLNNKRAVLIYTEEFNNKLKQTFQKYIDVKAQRPTAEGLSQEVIALCEEYYNKVGLPMYKHTGNIQIPKKLRDDFLLEEKMAIRISKDAFTVIDALRNDSELSNLLAYVHINSDTYRLVVNDKLNYKIDLKNMIASSKDDIIAQFYISSLKESKEYKALNHLVKGIYGEDKNLEDIDVSDLEDKIANLTVLNDYKKVELATKICIQKAKVMSKELDSNPEEKTRYEKYLVSNIHKKHLQEFERVRGMSYIEHEALQLSSVSAVVNFDNNIKSAVTEFVHTMNEDMDLKIRDEAARITHRKTMNILLATVLEIGMTILLSALFVFLVPAPIPTLLILVPCILTLAATATGITGIMVNKSMDEENKEHATRFLYNKLAEEKAYSNALDTLATNAATVVDALQALEAKQSKATARS